MNLRGKSLALTSALVAAGLSVALCGASAATPAPTPTAAPASPGWHSVIQQSDGSVALGPSVTTSQTSSASAASADSAVASSQYSYQTAACPAGAKHSGSQEPYNCLFMVNDLDGHYNKVRTGKTGSDASGGFGLIHAELDHSMTEEMVKVVFGNSHAQSNIDGAHKYRFEFVHLKSSGVADQKIRIISNRNTTNGSNDGYELGLQTGYCLSEPGDAQENQCPDWVRNDF